MNQSTVSKLRDVIVIGGVMLLLLGIVSTISYDRGLGDGKKNTHLELIHVYSRGWADGFLHLRPVDPTVPKAQRDSLQYPNDTTFHWTPPSIPSPAPFFHKDNNVFVSNQN